MSEQDNNLEYYDKIFKLPLKLTVEIGRVNLPIHEVAKLKKGDVIPLGKKPSTEVIILANGEPFAKGNIVTADNELGIKITEIIQETDRINSLR